MGVRPGDLGNQWVNLGVVQHSSTPTSSPSVCLPFEGIFSGSTAVAVHQYTFNTGAGYDPGNLTSTVVDTGSATAVTSEMRAVGDSAFGICVGGTAEQLLSAGVVNQPVIQSMTAQRTNLVTAANVIGWRTQVSFVGAGGPGVFGMDVFLASSGSRLAEIRVSRCSCPTPPIGPTSPLLPDEVLAVSAVSHRIAESATDLAPLVSSTNTAAGGNSTGPCLLLSDRQLAGLLPSATPGNGGTLSDGANECSWPQGSQNVAIQTGDTLAQFAVRLKDAPASLSGIGDQAASNPGLAGMVLARKGQIWIEVFVQGTIADRLNANDMARNILATL